MTVNENIEGSSSVLVKGGAGPSRQSRRLGGRGPPGRQRLAPPPSAAPPPPPPPPPPRPPPPPPRRRLRDRAAARPRPATEDHFACGVPAEYMTFCRI